MMQMQTLFDGNLALMPHETGLSMEERVASLFQPDTLLPTQYFEACCAKAHVEPEKRLMLAILEDAVACFQRYIFARDGRLKKMFREAEEWVMEEKSDWIFSFDSICEVLGMDPRYVRAGLVRWKEAQITSCAKAKICHLTPNSVEVSNSSQVQLA